MVDTEFGIERNVEIRSDMFVMYCPEKKQYVKGVEIKDSFIDFTFTDNVDEADLILLDKDCDRKIKRFGYEFELKLRRDL